MSVTIITGSIAYCRLQLDIVVEALAEEADSHPPACECGVCDALDLAAEVAFRLAEYEESKR